LEKKPARCNLSWLLQEERNSLNTDGKLPYNATTPNFLKRFRRCMQIVSALNVNQYAGKFEIKAFAQNTE
jgi:hypothetical protein